MRKEHFLKTLQDQCDDEVVRVIYSGRALSKSQEHLHLCTSTGIILVPIDQIEKITRIPDAADEQLVHVTVHNAENVRHVPHGDFLRLLPEAAPLARGAGLLDARVFRQRREIGRLIRESQGAGDAFDFAT